MRKCIVASIPELVTIRRATSADADALSESRFRFRSEVNAAGPLSEGTPLEARASFIARATRMLADHLDGGRWFAWLAEHEERVAGHVWLQLIDKLPNPMLDEGELLGYLTSFYVEPQLRGRRVGTRLIDALEVFAADSGVEKIVIVGATPLSRSLYARRGYVSTPDLLEKRPSRR
jgi:GNAT superfamily N-acetyltransferase